LCLKCFKSFGECLAKTVQAAQVYKNLALFILGINSTDLLENCPHHSTAALQINLGQVDIKPLS
jgi:hypothetical protein